MVGIIEVTGRLHINVPTANNDRILEIAEEYLQKMGLDWDVLHIVDVQKNENDI